MPSSRPIDDAIDADEAHVAWGRWQPWILAGIVGALVVGLVLRFVASSPLWLDEALSVNIARLPLGDIPEALRHDGHPPLYYVLLHGWMEAFGQGSGAVRAFSGLWGLALLPLLWIAGRRLGGTRTGWYVLAVAALSPYAIRYATETRMYAMVMVLVLAGWLVLDDALHRPARWHLPALAGLTGALLWTHYWAMWLLATVGLVLVVQGVMARRAGDADRWVAIRNAITVLVIGGLTFVPWLPSLLYQGSHTGTPWARPVRPAEMVTFTLADLGGGARSEAVVLGWFVGLLMLMGLMGRAAGALTVELDFRTRPDARALAVPIVGTMVVATVVGYATGATYASRYAAVFVPFALLLAALGLSRLDVRVAVGALGLLGVLGAIGGVQNATVDRSDAARSAAAITAEASDGDVVVYCPDQLGPSTSRLLGDKLDQVTYPSLDRPELVDWVDYKARLDAADPQAVAQQVLDRAGDHRIFLVYSTSYITHEETCPQLYNAIGVERRPRVLTSTTDVWEPSAVVAFDPPKA